MQLIIDHERLTPLPGDSSRLRWLPMIGCDELSPTQPAYLKENISAEPAESWKSSVPCNHSNRHTLITFLETYIFHKSHFQCLQIGLFPK